MPTTSPRRFDRPAAERPDRRARTGQTFLTAHAPYAIFLVLVVALALLGGSARATVVSLPVLRPVLALGIAGLLLLPPARRPLASVTVPLGLIGVLAAIMVVQLLPLPPSIWTHLPGQSSLARAAVLAGRPQPWRPATLVPILTINSLMALLAPLSVLLALTRLSVRDELRVVLTLLLVGIVSGMLGLVQLGVGEGGAAYLYAYARGGLATGLFANHNHEAVFLASLLPLLVFWAESAGSLPSRPSQRRLIAATVGFFFLLSVVVTGSRSGLGVAAVEMLAVGWMTLRPASAARSGTRWAGAALLAGTCVLVVALGLASGRETVFGRLGGLADDSAALRRAALPVTIDLVRQFFPVGSGFGTFDPVFRAAEPDAMLIPSYFNNAHNDLIELAITGGAPALLLLLAFLIWLGGRARAAFFGRSRVPVDGGGLARQAGLFLVIAFLLGSLSDYPLRTPLGAAMFAIGCGLLGRRAGSERDGVA